MPAIRRWDGAKFSVSCIRRESRGKEEKYIWSRPQQVFMNYCVRDANYSSYVPESCSNWLAVQ